MRSITLITTGGTIEKTFDESVGELRNRRSIVRRMLARLRLEEVNINVIELMSKDSLLMDDDDRSRIGDVVRAVATGHEARPVVILHGTDTLSVTGETLQRCIPSPGAPIVLTGAMRPYEMTRSDALQNLTEALFATSVLRPGVYVVAHGRALAFPGVSKDRARGTFVKA